jgi:hypothetical protein
VRPFAAGSLGPWQKRLVGIEWNYADVVSP